MSSYRWGLGQGRTQGVVLLVAAHLGLVATFDLAAHPAWTFCFIALGFTGLIVFLRRCDRSPGLSLSTLLLVAVVLRLLLLPLIPTLSDDLLRYVWDGRVLTAGFNPYELAPEAAELRELQDPLWEVMPHKDVPTVYPPISLALFSIAARLPQSVYVLKALLAFADVVGCVFLFGIARRRGIPRYRVAAYAWNPLVTLEVAGMGHVDALGVMAVIAAVYWLGAGARRPTRSALAASFGVLAKLVPLVTIPMWARQSGRPRLFLTVALATMALGFLPLVVATGGAPPGLLKYAVSWEFNGPLFEPLWRVLEQIEAPEVVARSLDGLKSLTGWHGFWNELYPYRYPQFLAKLVLWAVMLTCVALSWRRRDPVAGTGWLLGAAMLCSATVYPWYLLWILPWAALCRQRAWLVLSALIQLSYLPQLLDVPLFPWYYLAIWAPFALLLITRPRWSTD